jgi:hypothetical protein
MVRIIQDMRTQKAVDKAVEAAVRAATAALSRLSDAELEQVVENIDVAYAFSKPDIDYVDWKQVAQTQVNRYAWVLAVVAAAAELRQREQAKRIRQLEQECAAV